MEHRVKPGPIIGETPEAYRKRLGLFEAEAAERRRRQVDEQCSPLNTPSIRIRAWERLHRIVLPSDSRHRLIGVIAANTGLSTDEVRAEQQVRAAADG
jgi:hypothetical protein